MLNLGSILLVFWLHFEPILDPSASPEGSWGQGHETCTKCIDFGLPWASYLDGIFAQKVIKKSIKILLNFQIDFSLILRAKMAPKTPPKNLEKSIYKSVQKSIRFLMDFSLISQWFFKRFLSIFQWISSCEVNAATYDPLENFRVDQGSVLSAFMTHSFKNNVENVQKTLSKFAWIFGWFFIKKNLPKSCQKPSQNSLKIHSKNRPMF